MTIDDQYVNHWRGDSISPLHWSLSPPPPPFPPLCFRFVIIVVIVVVEVIVRIFINYKLLEKLCGRVGGRQ